jgi:hypothetical protein
MPRLHENRERRERASAELEAAKQELQEFLLTGEEGGLNISLMASEAGISRDTAHRILREVRPMSWPQKQRWASEILAGIPGGNYEQNEFRMFVNTLLFKALGRKPEDVPRSVAGILERATRDVRTIGKHPDFEPNFDPKLLGVPWPT